MHNEQDPAPATPPRPAPRPRAELPRSGLTLPRLILGVGVLLVLAWYLGKPKSPSTVAEAAPQPVTEPASASSPSPSSERSEARVLQGQKSTTLAQISEARMAVSEQGQVLRIDGSVGRNFANDLKAVLEANPSLQRIDITSGGGYAQPGLEAARMIRRRNLIVRVKSHCASMCVAIWAAGAQRQMEPDAVIGLHAWNAQCDVLPSPQREECNYQVQFATDHDASYDSWLREAGFNQYLLDLQAHTASENIAVVNALQLWENGVKFNVIDHDGTAMSRADTARYLSERTGRR